MLKKGKIELDNALIRSKKDTGKRLESPPVTLCLHRRTNASVRYDKHPPPTNMPFFFFEISFVKNLGIYPKPE